MVRKRISNLVCKPGGTRPPYISTLFPVILGSWLVALNSWLLARGSWLLARGSWLVARGSWLVALGSWFLILSSWLITPIHKSLQNKKPSKYYKRSFKKYVGEYAVVSQSSCKFVTPVPIKALSIQKAHAPCISVNI